MRPRLSFVRRPTVWVGARDLVWLGDASRLQAAVRAAKLRRQRADRAIPDRHWLARRSSRSLAVPVRPARRPIRDTHRKPASRAGPVGAERVDRKMHFRSFTSLGAFVAVPPTGLRRRLQPTAPDADLSRLALASSLTRVPATASP